MGVRFFNLGGIRLFFDDKREGNSDLSFDYRRRTLLILSIRAGNGRGYSHYALTRRVGKKDVMLFFHFILSKGKAKPSALHCRGKGDTVPKGWLVLVTETDTDKVLFMRDPLLTLIIPTSKRSGCSFIQGQRGE
ncbi:hypothetical protein RIF29_43369 [Crotalaria pallida]|uniref:Uncharacterized protein n=1 Tax=Crotalaria pallida TaxID=3830 RepID=A0AAN9HKC5_CROPI